LPFYDLFFARNVAFMNKARACLFTTTAEIYY